MNRLQYEKSPYLLQHTENPVDWRAWGADALETARREDKPIFLSIGYSTCHWCHVMAHESFESEEVAEALKGVEGKYYVFTTEELTRVLGEDAEVFCERYGVTKGGNFHGKSIPNLIDAMDWDAEVPETITRKLYDYRKTRAPLHCDDKVLAAWNGLMIASLARAGLTFDEPRYLRTAEKAAVFIRQRMTDAQGRLLSRWRDDEAAHPGKLDDYAFLAWGLLELYGATFDLAYLEDACRLAGILLEQFFDAEHGGFYPYNGSVNPDQGYEKRS